MYGPPQESLLFVQSPPSEPILDQLHPVHIFTLYFLILSSCLQAASYCVNQSKNCYPFCISHIRAKCSAHLFFLTSTDLTIVSNKVCVLCSSASCNFLCAAVTGSFATDRPTNSMIKSSSHYWNRAQNPFETNLVH
jgi:hypothetical protein